MRDMRDMVPHAAMGGVHRSVHTITPKRASTQTGARTLIQANIQIIKPTNAQGTIASKTASVAHHPNDASVEVTSFPDPKKHSCSLNVSRLRVRSDMGWGWLTVR
jgi:hypothetical protein